MKYLRLTHYPPGREQPLVTVVAEDSLGRSIYQVANEQREIQYAFPVEQRGDVAIFEFDDALSLEEVTARLITVPKATDAERHAATLHDWALAYCEISKPGSIIQTTRPAPLSPQQISDVLSQIGASPRYKGQRIVCIADDGRDVVLENGTVRFPASK